MATPPTTPAPITLSGDDATPKKYIRTFEGDMETYKKGGTPDLTPLVPKPVAPVVPPPITTQVPRPVPTPVPVALPKPPLVPPPLSAGVVSKRDAPRQLPFGSPAAGPDAGSVVPKQLPLDTSRVELATELPKPSPIQTYANDFSQRVKERGASTATVLAEEQDARSGAPQTSVLSARGSLVPIIAGVVLLLLGSAGAYIAFTRYQTSIQPIIPTPSVSALIFVDEKEEIVGTTSGEVTQTILQSVARPLAQNAVRLLYVTGATTTNRSVFSALQLPAPSVLLRNIDAMHSMAGIVNAGGTQSPFFILSVTAYGETFSGMLAWEPLMIRHLEVLFPPHSAPVVTELVIATSTVGAKKATSTPPAPVFTPSFRDEVLGNHDVRVYRDAGGRSVLVYGYWNQTTLVIARDLTAFTEILSRLATTRAEN